MPTLSRPRLVFSILLAAAVLSACSPTSPTAAPATAGSSAPPSSSPAVSGIAHPTGAKDVVLRYDQSGGFVPVEFLAAHVPLFTLYGDGTVVFVPTSGAADPRPDGIVTGSPLRTARLSEEQVQALLQLALGDGGLGIARAEYQNPLVADAPTAVFEVHAAGADKTVSVVALGLDDQPGPDSVVKAALAKLGNRLGDFDQGGSFSSAPFQPAAYRGVLLDAGGQPGGPAKPWPWASLTPADFAFPADPNALRQGTRVLSADEVAQLGIGAVESGIQSGVWLTAPDGAVYSLVIRPLLPDEAA